jgi:hypothetical protein
MFQLGAKMKGPAVVAVELDDAQRQEISSIAARGDLESMKDLMDAIEGTPGEESKVKVSKVLTLARSEAAQTGQIHFIDELYDNYFHWGDSDVPSDSDVKAVCDALAMLGKWDRLIELANTGATIWCGHEVNVLNTCVSFRRLDVFSVICAQMTDCVLQNESELNSCCLPPMDAMGILARIPEYGFSDSGGWVRRKWVLLDLVLTHDAAGDAIDHTELLECSIYLDDLSLFRFIRKYFTIDINDNCEYACEALKVSARSILAYLLEDKSTEMTDALRDCCSSNKAYTLKYLVLDELELRDKEAIEEEDDDDQEDDEEAESPCKKRKAKSQKEPSKRVKVL